MEIGFKKLMQNANVVATTTALINKLHFTSPWLVNSTVSQTTED